jgi:hypothetical protein
MEEKMIPSHSQLLFELELCSIEQGYGEDLRPLYKKPVLNFLTYLRLTKILNGGHYGFRH